MTTGELPRDTADPRLADALALARQAAAERDTALERIAQLEHEIVHAAAVRDVHVRQGQALASHLWRLQRQVSALLGSRRWKMGQRLGDVLDRVLLRHRDLAEDERIQHLIDGGRRLLGTVGETEIQLEAERGRGLAEAAPRRDFAAYLRDAVTDPVLEAPLGVAGQHAVDVMDAYRDLLVRRWAGRLSGPLVSVIMPTYDRASLLPRAIGSVLDQSYEHWELVVVDDGSTDGSDALLRAYTDPRITVVPLEENRGVSHARNRGLEKSTGDLVAYLDSDNYWDEHYLLCMVGALGERPGRDSVYCAQQIWEIVAGEDGEPVRRFDGVRFAPFNRALLENRNYIDLNAFVHRRELGGQAVGFDESLPRLVDWELFLRLTAQARPVALPCLLSHYEFGTAKNQLTRTIPVRPATQAIDDATLQQVTLEVTLPPAVAAGYRNPRLHAPLGGPRPVRATRPVSLFVFGEAGARVRLCLDAVRGASPGADVRFFLPGGAHAAAARSAVSEASLAADVEVVEPGEDPEASLREAIRSAATGQQRDVVLLAPDAVVTPGWLEAFWEVLDRVPGAGLVAPRVVVMPGSPSFSEHVPYAKTYRELDVTLSRRDHNVLDPQLDDERGFVELSWARLTCAYLPRETVAEAGAPALEPLMPDRPAERAARVYGDLLRTVTGRRIVYTPHAKVYHLP